MLDAPAALDQSQLDELNLVVDIKRISKFFRFLYRILYKRPITGRSEQSVVNAVSANSLRFVFWFKVVR